MKIIMLMIKIKKKIKNLMKIKIYFITYTFNIFKKIIIIIIYLI